MAGTAYCQPWYLTCPLIIVLAPPHVLGTCVRYAVLSDMMGPDQLADPLTNHSLVCGARYRHSRGESVTSVVVPPTCKRALVAYGDLVSPVRVQPRLATKIVSDSSTSKMLQVRRPLCDELPSCLLEATWKNDLFIGQGTEESRAVWKRHLSLCRTF